MPNYYNPANFYPVTYPGMGTANFNPYPVQSPVSMAAQPQYMYQVEGEVAAKVWMPPGNVQLPPNTLVPLWDYDGEHVYFKSTDAYGRMNPIRKARVVFEDTVSALPQGQSGAANEVPGSVVQNVSRNPDMSQYVTKDDFHELKNEIKNLMSEIQASQIQSSTGMNSTNPGLANQNGNHGQQNNRGGK